jgi:hypothetical protein
MGATACVYQLGLSFSGYSADAIASGGNGNTASYLSFFNSPPANSLTTFGFTTSLANLSAGTKGYYVDNNGQTYFSVQWQGKFVPQATGNYTFATTSDDGSALYVNGNLIVNNVYTQSATTRSGKVSLTANSPASIQVLFSQTGGGYSMYAYVTPPGGSALDLGAVCYTPPGLEFAGYSADAGAGFGLGSRYINFFTSQPASQRSTYGLSSSLATLSTGTNGYYADNGIQAYFSVQWWGTYVPPVSGTYTFATTSDDGSAIAVNGIWVVNNVNTQAATFSSGTVALTANSPVSIRVLYSQGEGGYSLSAQVSSGPNPSPLVDLASLCSGSTAFCPPGFGISGSSSCIICPTGQYSTGSTGCLLNPLYTMTFPFTFTNMGATGAAGPTSVTYGASGPSGLVLSGGIQYWTVPASQNYSFTVAGAGSANPSSQNSVKVGSGVVLSATYSLTRGQILAILVGQAGTSGNACNSGDAAGSGGGGTFVARVTSVGALSTAAPLFVAGGAGGPGYESASYANAALDGTLSTAGRNGADGSSGSAAYIGSGGVGPAGGKTPTNNAYSWSDSGAGFSGSGQLNAAWSSGQLSNVAQPFTNGGKGDTNCVPGGFGGGGAAVGYGTGGGGGGYGGGGSGGSDGAGTGGGGGGSYDITGAYLPLASNTGMGYVTVSQVP